MNEQLNEHNMTPIEEQHIKGISLKTLYAIITSTAVIVVFIMTLKGSISNLQDSVNTMQRLQDKESIKNSTELESIKARLNAIEADNKELHYRLSRMENYK